MFSLVFPVDLWTVLGLDHYLMLLAAPQHEPASSARSRGHARTSRNVRARLPHGHPWLLLCLCLPGAVTGSASLTASCACLEAAVLYQTSKQ